MATNTFSTFGNVPLDKAQASPGASYGYSNAGVSIPISGGGGYPGFDDMIEKNRAATFKDFVNTINKAIMDAVPTKTELAREGESLRNRLAAARTDKLLAAIYGAGGNPVAVEMAKSAAQQEQLLTYLYDTYKDNPKQYIAFKKAEMMEKIAPFTQAAGQLTVAGGEGRAEAGAAYAQLMQARAMWAQIALAGKARQVEDSDGGQLPAWILLQEYLKVGGDINSKIGQSLQKALLNNPNYKQIIKLTVPDWTK